MHTDGTPHANGPHARAGGARSRPAASAASRRWTRPWRSSWPSTDTLSRLEAEAKLEACSVPAEGDTEAQQPTELQDSARKRAQRHERVAACWARAASLLARRGKTFTSMWPVDGRRAARFRARDGSRYTAARNHAKPTPLGQAWVAHACPKGVGLAWRCAAVYLGPSPARDGSGGIHTLAHSPLA